MSIPSVPDRSAHTVNTIVDLEQGAAAGAVAGFAAAAVMNGFQSLVTPLFRPQSGDGPPATEQAADHVALVMTGRGLAEDDRRTAGTAVHYLVGTATGALYGAWAERRPGVTRWQGLGFGLVCATLIDQIAVPLAGLARPPWRYTLRTHLYGYASHLVFGLVTEQVRKLLRDRIARRRPAATAGQAIGRQTSDDQAMAIDDVCVPLLLGLAGGQRTFTPPAAITIAAASSGLGLEGTPLALLNSRWTGLLFGAAAAGEYVMDKQPGIPARIAPAGLAGRAVGGALSGAAAAQPGKAWLAAGVGAAGAIAGAYVSYRVRMTLARALGRDRPVAFAEDALALVGTALVATYASARQKQREQADTLVRHGGTAAA